MGNRKSNRECVCDIESVCGRVKKRKMGRKSEETESVSVRGRERESVCVCVYTESVCT
jgi:hypothetical protein